jgi:conserved oligomeric Golgi complex subunit 8
MSHASHKLKKPFFASFFSFLHTEFNAIFRAQASSASTAAALGVTASSSNADSVALLLSMWTSRRVYAFLTLLQTAQQTSSATSSLSAGSNHSASGTTTTINNAGMLLPDASSLRDALEASIFFASSMGRLGADFTAQLPAIFEPRMHDIVVSYWRDGAKQLNETLKVCREAGVATPLLVAQSNISSSQRDVMMESSSSSNAATGGSSAFLKMHWTFSETTVGVEGPQASAPRQVLMAMPPMARLVNAVLMGLNELRRCLLPGMFSRLRSCLQAILQDEILSTILTQNQRAVMVPGLRGDAAGLRHVATLYKQVMTEVVTPYCLGSLEAALGNHVGAVEYYKTAQENMKPPEPVQEEKEEEKEQLETEIEQTNEENSGVNDDAQEVGQVDEQPTGQEEVNDD